MTTAVPARDLRAYVLAAEKLTGAAQLRALANVRDHAQRLEDELLLELLEEHTTTDVAHALGITRQAVHQRAQHARGRLGGGS
jgi:DNA-directed RNA polymerase specialized sigma24 family protein